MRVSHDLSFGELSNYEQSHTSVEHRWSKHFELSPIYHGMSCRYDSGPIASSQLIAIIRIPVDSQLASTSPVHQQGCPRPFWSSDRKVPGLKTIHQQQHANPNNFCHLISEM